jgi:hypothetical protein
MQHSQLQIVYPDCPFIWDYNDMSRTFDCEYIPMLKDKFIDEIINELYKSEDETDIDMDKLTRDDIITYITNMNEIDDTDNKLYHKISYHTVRQTIPFNLSNLLINFQCASYCLNKSSYLDSEFQSNISWTIVPLVGDVKPINDKIKIRNNISNTSNTSNTNRNIDQRPSNFISDARPKQRGLYVRTYNPDADNPKGDQTDAHIQNTSSFNSNSVSRPITSRVHQIELNKNTRFNAHIMRSNLMSEGKQRRLRHLPEFIANEQRKVDLSIRGVSDKIVNTHNDRSRSLQTTISRDTYDMIDETITIHKVNNIYRFSPNSTGRIQFNKNKKNDTIKFITILRQNNYLSFSLNIVNLV